MVNSALAAGGVERQIVNTLCLLGRYTDRRLGMLCLRLGEQPYLDFFKPALAHFPGFVRNAMPVAEANRALESILSKSANQILHQAISWMPSDVQEDILRFAAEFATLKPSVVHAWQDSTGIAAGYAARMIGVLVPIGSHDLCRRMAAMTASLWSTARCNVTCDSTGAM